MDTTPNLPRKVGEELYCYLSIKSSYVPYLTIWRHQVMLGVVAHAYKPSTQEVELGGLPWVWGQPELHNESMSQKKMKIK